MTKTVYLVFYVLLICSPLINCQRPRNVVSKAPNCLGLLSTLSTASELEGKYTLELENGPRVEYEPFEKYSIILRSNDINTHFKEFNIIAESEDKNAKIKEVGRFERYKEALTKYSDDCPNGVTQSSLLPKQGIKVKWIAPPSGSGCIRFRAATRNLEQWMTNSNSMSFVICEENQLLDGQPKILSKCTACDEAKYGVEITGLWSRNTHPVDYPKNAWDAAISDFIGASHSNFFHIFSKDEMASEPLRKLAEDGQSKYLVQLMNERENKFNIRTVIKARGITHPLLNGKTFAEFRVDRDHHLMSLVAKLEPSPDWFIGVDSLELCNRNGSWIDEKQMNLYLFDAGTDGGSAYENANKFPLKFREKIYQLTNLHPQNSPFYNLNESKIKPFARIKVVKQRLFPTKQPCRLVEAPEEEEEPDDSLERNLVYGENENLASIPPYNRYKPSLRSGFDNEMRGYDDNREPTDYGADNNYGNNYDNRYGGNNNGYDNNGETDTSGREVNSKETNDPSSCATSEYTEWSECQLQPNNPNPNCGPGLSTRARELLNPSNADNCRFVLLRDDKYCEVPCDTDLEYQQGNRDTGDNYGGNKYSDNNRFRNNRPDSFAVDQDRLVNRKNYEDQDMLNNRDQQNRPDTYGNEDNNEQPDSSYDTGDTNYGGNDYGRNDYGGRNEDYRNTNEPSTYGDPYNNDRIPDDCKASEWSEWSSCIGDCSVGKYRNRTRSLTTFDAGCLLMPLVEQQLCEEECGGRRGGFRGGLGRQRTRIMPRNVTPRMPRSRPANKNTNAKINDRNQLRTKKDNRSGQRLNARNVASAKANSRSDNRRNTNQKNVNKKNENSELSAAA